MEYFLTVLGLVVLVLPSPSSSEVTTPRDQWRGNEGECLQLIDNPVQAENIRRLALTLLGRYDDTVGCVTFPYLGSPYDVPGINNAAHAGIDFRANGVPVRSAEAGRVVTKSFDLAAGHSTLIIENNGRTRKTLYLHMARIDVADGDYVFAGQPIGLAGSVGACANTRGGCPHLHFEVWPNSSPLYCSRQKAISGSACPDEGGTCSTGNIEWALTQSPERLIQYPDNTAKPKRATPSVSYADRVTSSGVGVLKVGSTAWESLKGLDELVLGDDSAECSMVRLQSADCGLSVMLSGGRIRRVDVDHGEYRTADGFGIGSTETELRKLYGPRLKSEPNRYTEGVVDMWVDSSVDGQRRSLLFVVANGKVTSFRAGEAAAVGLVEHCL